MSTAVDAFIGLGSNLDGPAAQVTAALECLAALPDSMLHARSRLYASAPMGPQDQPDYVNAVAWLRTHLSPHALLDRLQAIEHAAGRRRTDGQRWGPRPLDLDLLMWGDLQIAEERLTLPHPGIAERAFVLFPWAEIAPAQSVPGLGRVDGLAAARDDGTVYPLSVRRHERSAVP